MIRPAEHRDIAACVEMGREFHRVAGWEEVAPFCELSFSGLLGRLIDNESGVLLVSEDAGSVTGMAAGMVFPLYYNEAVSTGQELFWWVAPGARGLGLKLLTALEAAAREAGAGTFQMGCLERVTPDALARLYLRRGYEPLEHIYRRKF